MIELVAGDTKDYETLLAERVLSPLGITRFGFGVPTKADAASLVGHTEQGAPREIDNPNAIAPAGTLHMPLGEWAKFIAFHLGAKAPAALEGAARELPKLHERAKDAPFEALGWLSATRPWGGAVLTHAGSNTMWYCVAWLAPEKGFAVLAATNQGGDAAAKACDEACAAMIQAVVKPAARPE
jgi:CubicO group peptidase (beta-lactamase class C family)